MKVLLVNPPIISSMLIGEHPTSFQPMGLAYVAAAIEKEHKVSILDAPGEGWRNLRKISANDEKRWRLGLEFDEIARRIERDRPDAIGITIPFSTNNWSALHVASIAKKIDKDIITIVGGPHPSVRPIETLTQPDIDFIIVGEGEYSTLELLRKLEQGRYSSLDEVKGIGYRASGKPVITSARPNIQDLNSLPFPARHLLPMDEYFVASKANELYRLDIPPEARWATMITSRGCPFRCVFCSIHAVMGRKWRARSPENVLQEIEELTSKYNIDHICFEDDNMTLNRKRTKRICELIIERKLDITWSLPNGVRADTLDENLIRKMSQSGCRHLFVAPESGSQRVVNQIIKKNMDLGQVEEVVPLLKKYGIIVDVAFVIGLIGETKEDIHESLQFAYKMKRLGCDGIAVHIAVPYYGTELYEEAKKRGYLRKIFDDEHLNTAEPLIETPELTADELLELRDQFIMIAPLSTLLHLCLTHPNLAIRRMLSINTWKSFLRHIGRTLSEKVISKWYKEARASF